MIYLYLQIMGLQSERLLLENHLWTFNLVDFERAITTFVLHNEDEKDETVLQIRELILKQLEHREMNLVDWAKDVYQKVK